MKPYSHQEAVQYKKTRSTWPEVLDFFLKHIKSNNFLDAGCGTGNDLMAIYEKTGFIGWGADKSDDMLIQTKSKGCLSPLKQADLDSEFPYEHEFETIYLHDVIHHLKSPSFFINNSYGHLVLGGVLIIGSEFQEGLREKFSSLYFKGALEADMNRYYGFEEINGHVKSAGFNKTEILKINDSILIDDQIMQQVRTRSHSILHLVTDVDFAEGLEKMEKDYKTGKLKFMKRDYTLLAAYK